MKNSIVKPFLWNKVSDIDLTEEHTESWERLTASANEENNSKTVDIILDKN